MVPECKIQAGEPLERAGALPPGQGHLGEVAQRVERLSQDAGPAGRDVPHAGPVVDGIVLEGAGGVLGAGAILMPAAPTKD